MKRFYLIVLLVLGMFIISCDLFDNENENDELSIEISPEESTLAVDEEIILDVKLENVEDLFAMSVEIVFDAAVVELPDEPLIVSDDWGVDCISTYVSELDRINVAIGFTGGNAELESDVDLFQFKLVGVATGQTMVNIHNLNLYDEDGNPVEDFDEIEIENAVVIVE